MLMTMAYYKYKNSDGILGLFKMVLNTFLSTIEVNLQLAGHLIAATSSDIDIRFRSG